MTSPRSCDKSSTAHVLSGDAQVLNDERVPKNKANCDVDAGVVVHHFVGEPEDAVLSGRHDRFSTGTRTGEFVEGEEGGSTCTVFGQPSNSVGGVLVRLHDHRGHACADGGGQRHLVGTVLGRTEFSHGTNDALQLLIVSSGDDGASTTCKSFCAGFCSISALARERARSASRNLISIVRSSASWDSAR